MTSRPRNWILLLALVAACFAGTATAGAGPEKPVVSGGGPVMHSNHVHAVYWAGDGLEFPPGYTELIDRFFGDVAADSGQPSNVYAVTPEYSDGAGPAAYDSTYAGRTDDAAPYPVGSCASAERPRCVDNAELEAELNRLIDAQGLPRGPEELYAVFMPAGVSVCQATNVCSPDYFCGVHDALADRTPYFFVAQPTIDHCGTSAHPNGNLADAALSTVSHEHIEAISDPLGTAWGDAAGQEIADKCSESAGQPLGATETGVYNQLVNGRPYWLQGEWSNAAGACILHAPIAPPVAAIDAPRVVVKGSTAVLNGGRSSGLRLRSEWDLPDGTTASGAAVRFRFREDGPAAVALRVIDAVGQTATAEMNVDVRNPPRPRAVVHVKRVTALRWRFSAARAAGNSVRWRFGDGTRSRGSSVVHRFRRPGRYRVRLTVVQASGAGATGARPIRATATRMIRVR